MFESRKRNYRLSAPSHGDGLEMQDSQVIVDFQRDIADNSCQLEIEDGMRIEVNSSVVP